MPIVARHSCCRRDRRSVATTTAATRRTRGRRGRHELVYERLPRTGGAAGAGSAAIQMASDAMSTCAVKETMHALRRQDAPRASVAG